MRLSSTSFTYPICLAVLLFGEVAAAQEVISVAPYTPPTMNDTPVEFPTTSRSPDLTLTFKLACYAPNLRHTPMPAAPDADLTIEIGVRSATNRDQLNILRVHDVSAGANPAPMQRLMGWHFKPFYWASSSIADAAIRNPNRAFNLTVSAPANGLTGQATLRNNELKVLVRGAFAPAIAADGSVNPDEINAYGVEFVRVTQKGAPNSAYAGSDGPVNANVRFRTSADGRMVTGSIDVPAAALPGQIPSYQGGLPYTDFCGGWFSPLILFFDDKRPLFSGTSNFPLADGLPVHWPEKGAPGFFLALDTNKDGRITAAEELFTPNNEGDGFTALAIHDANKDGVIDDKDPVFERLLLWQDKNGDGKSTPKELMPLKKKSVVSIDLKSEKVLRSFGGRAESRAEAPFSFSHKGELKKGIAMDVYFSQPLNLASDTPKSK